MHYVPSHTTQEGKHKSPSSSTTPGIFLGYEVDENMPFNHKYKICPLSALTEMPSMAKSSGIRAAVEQRIVVVRSLKMTIPEQFPNKRAYENANYDVQGIRESNRKEETQPAFQPSDDVRSERAQSSTDSDSDSEDGESAKEPAPPGNAPSDSDRNEINDSVVPNEEDLFGPSDHEEEGEGPPDESGPAPGGSGDLNGEDSNPPQNEEPQQEASGSGQQAKAQEPPPPRAPGRMGNRQFQTASYTQQRIY